VIKIIVYLAGNTRTEREKKLVAQGCTSRLLSFWEYRKKVHSDFLYWRDLTNEGKSNLFLDSGAYSAMTSGGSIDIDVYCNFIELHKHGLTVYATLDVIGDADGTLENFKYMVEKRNLNPLPVFHGGEDEKYLDYYCSNYEYVAIGGIAGVVSDRNSIRAFMEWVFNKYPNHKFHAFGITISSIITDYPFYSCDSTSWLMSGANGNIFTPHGNVYISTKSTSDPSHYVHKNEVDREIIKQYVESKGFTIEELCNDYNPRLLLNALFMKEFQDSHIYKPKPIKKRRLF
jgi:hypothetical protein